MGEDYLMNKFEKIWLTAFFIELFAGGGGRLIDFGFISIRQILFIGLLLIYLVRVVKEKAVFDKRRNTFLQVTPVAIGIYLILGWFIISSLIGLVHHHPLEAVASDFLRVIFFVVYFPLVYFLSKNRFPIENVITILKKCALVVAVFTIIVTLLGKTVFVNNFDEFYNFMNKIMHDDLFFRPSNGVFYKSHFFVLVALVLSLNGVLNKKFTKIDIAMIILGTVSIIWSETRGFLLALILSLLLIILFDLKVIVDPIKGFAHKMQIIVKSQQFLKKFAILLLIIIAVPNIYNYMTIARFQTVKVEEPTSTSNNQKVVKQEVNDESVNARMKFIVASKDILVHPENLIIGSGYGTTIAGRITGIEMSFLDILVEQGLIGLATWFFLFLLVYINYYSAYKKGEKFSSLDISLLSVFMGILLLTNINPFINNPIGISFLIILLIASQNKKNMSLKGNFE